MSKPSDGRGGARVVVLKPKRPRKKTIKISNRERTAEGEGPISRIWRTPFLHKLAETSNVTASALYAEVSQSRAYKVRREDTDFAAKWRAALLEGYEHLELEVLGHLRAADPARKMDVAGALKLLALHAQTVARERALREDDDEQAVLDSIDAFIEEMRQRRAANAAILIEDYSETGPTDGAD
jgi:hypothetical protein